MRILSPTGKVYKVFKAVPCAEKKEIFNGKVIVKTEEAINLGVHPTGIKLLVEKEPNDFCLPSVYIGNLAFEKVQEILSTLMKEGCYDFSKFEYQRLKNCFDNNMKIDGGISLPYYRENACSDNMFSVGNNIEFPVEYEDDLEDELEDECEEGDEYEE